MLGLFENFGLGEILLILAVLLLLFGASRLPEVARSLGRSSHEFKKGLREGSKETEEERAAKAAPTSSSNTSTE